MSEEPSTNRPAGCVGIRWTSRRRLLGLPLYDIAFGPDPIENQPQARARGVLAIGNLAFGVIAVGGVARGLIAIGGVAIGLFSIGGLAVGLLFAAGGCAIGGTAFGGVAIGIIAGTCFVDGKTIARWVFRF